MSVVMGNCNLHRPKGQIQVSPSANYIFLYLLYEKALKNRFEMLASSRELKNTTSTSSNYVFLKDFSIRFTRT